MSKPQKELIPVNVAVLTSSDTRTAETDTSGDLIQQLLEDAGHKVVARRIHHDVAENLRAIVNEWITNPDIDVIITTGGSGLTRRDVMPEAVTPLITKPIPGFGELFRMLSYEEIGTSTIESRAFAGVCDDTLVFCLPGSNGACRLGVVKIILPQLDARTRPCNLVAMLPRIRHE